MTEEQFCGLPPKPGSWNRPRVVDNEFESHLSKYYGAAMKERQMYLDQISENPTSEMIRDGNGYQYIPKSILQRELNRIYQGQIKWEMQRDSVTNKGMWGTGMLHVRLPFNGEWIFFTGTASIPLAKGMRMDYPKLEAQCFKNACKKIGAWFGQNLNLHIEDAEPEITEPEESVDEKTEVQLDRLKSLIAEATTLEKLAEYKRDIDRAGFGKMLTKDYMKKVKELSVK